MAGVTPFELGAETSKTVKGTIVKNTREENVFNEETKKWEEKQVPDSINEYRGGSIFGFIITAKEASEFSFFDNAEEEEKGTKYGPFVFKEKETKIVTFPYPLRFNTGLYCKVASGKLVGQVLCGIE